MAEQVKNGQETMGYQKIIVPKIPPGGGGGAVASSKSILIGFLIFANKIANIKYKKLISLQYRVRAIKSHIQNSTNHFFLG